MKFTRTRNPIPGTGIGFPCWRLETRLFVIDADWNVWHRVPVGACFGVYDPAPPPGPDALKRWSVCLDVNPPLGEPNRLYLNVGAVSVVLALWPGNGCDRYRYVRDADGAWQRKAKPEPLHWGWLTVERRRKRTE